MGYCLDSIIKLAIHNLLPFCLTCIALFSVTSNLYSERVNICNHTTYSQSLGTACSFNAQLGEEIVVWARYRDNPIYHHDYSRVTLNPFGNFMDIYTYEQKTLKKRISWGENKSTKVDFFMAWHVGGDYLDIEVYSDRSNLYVWRPQPNPDTGELVIPWGVSTNTPYIPVAYSSIKVWASKAHNGFEHLLGTYHLNECNNKALCTGHVRVPLSQRAPVPRGMTSLESFIDHERGHIETDESDSNNHRTTYLGNFFGEQVPTIMTNRNYDLASAFLNTWFESGREQKDINKNGIDWSLDTRIGGHTNWFLDPNNVSNDRIKKEYDWIVEPNKFNTQGFRNALRGNIKKAFKNNPSAPSVKLSEPYHEGDNIKDYHQQHVQFRPGQSSYSVLDHVTAAFGNFSFYLVPRGNAVIHNSEQFLVTINKVAIHVIDSFDFNGSQDLGCWGLPNKVELLYYPGLTCLNDPSFRSFRNINARGFDYNIFMKPKVVTLTNPFVFTIQRN